MVNNFCREVVSKGGQLIPLIFNHPDLRGTGLMNPSIYNDRGRLLINIRHINYVLWHNENNQYFNSRYGPLVYFNPEDDVRLATKNYVVTLNKDFSIKDVYPTHTEKLDSPTPLWEFHGLEDARLVRWNNKLYQIGVRRDTTPHGEGRMELSEIILTDFECTEVSRERIPMPNEIKSYCEKNWVPIIDKPYHFVKWTNPTEIVYYDTVSKTTSIVLDTKIKNPNIGNPRGGSQVIKYKNYWITIAHEVNLFNNVQDQKDGIYRHRFIVWDKDWNIVANSDILDFMDARIEFSCGMCFFNGDLLITFGFQDNAAFLLQVPGDMVDDILGLNQKRVSHIYHQPQFGTQEEDWFTYPKLYSGMVKRFPSGSRFVEVGSYKGKSSAYMAIEIVNSGKDIQLNCVDTFEDTEEIFSSNMKELKVVPWKMSSVEASKCFSDRSLEFVFIDASHEKEDVKTDIKVWLPKVKIGGILAGHDYHADGSYHPGVRDAVHELIDEFGISEMCWIHEVKEQNKLEGFPSVYCVTLFESEDRRKNLLRHFAPYGIKPVFCEFERYKDEDELITGSRVNEINLHAKGSNISNLLTIKKWYYDTKEEYGFICEDDLSLETVQYWPFTWKEFINRLPSDWECVQLLQVRENWNNHKLKVREKDDLCNAAYIIKREYAKKLLDAHYLKEYYDYPIDDPDNVSLEPTPDEFETFILDCSDIPTVENILFTGIGKVYSIPLFVEDVPNTVTTFPETPEMKHSYMHEESYNEIVNFWKDNGHKFTLKDFTPLYESWKDVKSPILEITTNILSSGCIIGCIFCPQKTLIENYNSTRLLTIENFKLVIDKLPKDIGVIFAGLSEPWLNAHCTEMVQYAYNQGHRISIFTTGIGMKVSDIEILKSIPYENGPNRGFTLHVPDIEGYANHVVTKQYLEVLGAIRDANISHLRVVSMGTVPENILKIFPEVQKAEMYSRAGNLQKEALLRPRLSGLSDKYLSVDNGEGKSYCISPEGHHHTVMLPNGDVSICCQDYETKHIIGNLFIQEYVDIVPEEITSFELCRYCENGKQK